MLESILIHRGLLLQSGSLRLKGQYHLAGSGQVHKSRDAHRLATRYPRGGTDRFGRLPTLAGRVCIPYIHGTTPFTIGFSAPDCDRAPLGSAGRSVRTIHRDCIPAEEIREVSIR
ncbi:hypothetical protein BH20ACI3_BH20ACI3_03900 [soil metagenome]